MKCPICQIEMKNGVCPSCGFTESSSVEPEYCPEETAYGAQQADHPGEPLYTPPRRKGPRTGVLVAIGIALFVVILTAVILAFSLISYRNGRLPTYSEHSDNRPSAGSSAWPNSPAQNGEQLVISSDQTLPALSELSLTPSDLTEQVVYQSNGLTVIARSLSFQMDDYTAGGRTALDLYIRNDSDRDYEVDVSGFTVNGVSVGGSGWFYATAGDRFSCSAELDSSVLLRSGITSIGAMEFDVTCAPQDSTSQSSSAAAEITRVSLSAGGTVSSALPQGLPVYQQNGVGVFYVGAAGEASYDGSFQPQLWFLVVNDTDTALQPTVGALVLDGRTEEYPSYLGDSISAHSSGLLCVYASSYSDALKGQETLDDISDAEVRMGIYSSPAYDTVMDSTDVLIHLH